jgi:negative regulator of sigma E activity
VPKGFLLYRDSVGVREFGGAPVLWFQHTDGVRTFSVFQRKAAAAARRGLQSTNVLRVGDYQITIVGPLTPEELTTIKAGYLSPGR